MTIFKPCIFDKQEKSLEQSKCSKLCLYAMLIINMVNIIYRKEQSLELHSGFFSFVVYIATNRAKLVYPISSSAKGVQEDFRMSC